MMKSRINVLSSLTIALLLTACKSALAISTASVETAFRSTSSPSLQPTTTPKPPDSELISLDEEWNQYINRRLGFSMNIPKSMYRHDANCYWNDEDGDNSYRPEGGVVPVALIEDGDRVYITSKYVTELTQPTQIPSGLGYRYTYGGCERLETDQDVIQKREYSSYLWEIVVREIRAEDDLETLIDHYYGDCFHLGEIEPIEGRALSRVKVLGDGKPFDESTCLLTGMYTFFYAPDLGLAATWKTGQSVHFAASPWGEGAYDDEMMASFRFMTRVAEN
jgi:hypothetical protein